MAIFKIHQNKLEAISEKKIDLERDIQKLTEQNLSTVFGLQFVCGSLNQELCIRVGDQDYYIDTLGFDESNKSVTIIEYKKDKIFSVIDQGYAYLSATLDKKGDIVLQINERLNKKLSIKDINWDATRIFFISTEYTNYQKSAINFKDLPMELYQARRYANETIEYISIKPNRISESIKKFIKDKNVQEVNKEVKVYSVEDHLNKASTQTKELYEIIREKILDIDNRIQEKPVSWYIGYRVRYHNFCSLAIYKERIRIHVRATKINDEQKLFKKIPSSYAWGKTPVWYYDIKETDKINYAVSIIKQGYDEAPDK